MLDRGKVKAQRTSFSGKSQQYGGKSELRQQSFSSPLWKERQARDYRKAHGLCFYCAEKFEHGHAEKLLSVKTHRRATTGNTKSREVAGALAGTASSSTARNPGTCRGFLRRRACHLTYNRSGRCDRACDDLPAYTNMCKHKSEPWSAPRDDSCIGSPVSDGICLHPDIVE